MTNRFASDEVWRLRLSDMPTYVKKRRGWPQVDVFFVDLDAHTERLDMHHGVLSSIEREQALAVRHAQQRNRMVVSRGLLRHVIADYLGVRAADVPLQRDGLGKPNVRIDNGANVHVSSSRSGSTAVFVVGNVDPMGVDVERLSPDNFSNDVAGDMLTATEHALFARVPENERLIWLAQAWVRKEAVLKALGCGLGGAPNTVEVMRAITPTTQGCQPDMRPSPYPPRWFFQERHWKDNVIALAVRVHACSVRWAQIEPAAEMQPELVQASTEQAIS